MLSSIYTSLIRRILTSQGLRILPLSSFKVCSALIIKYQLVLPLVLTPLLLQSSQRHALSLYLYLRSFIAKTSLPNIVANYRSTNFNTLSLIYSDSKLILVRTQPFIQVRKYLARLFSSKGSQSTSIAVIQRIGFVVYLEINLLALDSLLNKAQL